jgi:hypothetical protein
VNCTGLGTTLSPQPSRTTSGLSHNHTAAAYHRVTEDETSVRPVPIVAAETGVLALCAELSSAARVHRGCAPPRAPRAQTHD